jgi:hypothetical protein
MPGVVVKCKYYKNAASGNLGGMVRYIATREGVEKIPKDQQSLPETGHQQQFIAEIVSRNSTLKTSLEYRSYQKEKTRSSASEFIAYAIESNPRLLNTEEYLRYMALRPRAERITGDHGLFSSKDGEINLEEEIEKLKAHPGNVYSVIISLKREDAERLGYSNASKWRDMIRDNAADIAKQHNIPMTDLCWYGAFHNESRHPHVHMILYSTAESDQSFIGKKGLNNLRHLFGSEIFKDEIHEIYDRQTAVRNKLTDEMRSEFKKLIDEANAGKIIDHRLMDMLEELAHRLNECKGKKQYGYLPKNVKKLVDEIVDDVSGNTTVDRLYDLWYQAKCSVFATYTDQLPEKLPLSQEKTFKAIRNALVYEASRLGFEMFRATNSSISRKSTGSEEKRKGTDHRRIVAGAAIRFASSLARVFYDNYKKYDPEEDDIDKQLRREIWAVKNGQNLVM